MKDLRDELKKLEQELYSTKTIFSRDEELSRELLIDKYLKLKSRIACIMFYNIVS